ncbi:MAG: site-specific DNA-methyltransferase [Deltaproteobacteria bacterium]|nr:site-specific DNA-methyltransferase [Deltaproteobacteria bacterium]
METRVHTLVTKRTVGDARTGNILVKGDCLAGMRALEDRLMEKIQLVYADPPYNTRRKGRDYDDDMDPGKWLTMLEQRAVACRSLLKPTGWFFLHLDANGLASAKLMMDRIMGEENFTFLVTWERTPKLTFLGQGASPIVRNTEFILVYSKNRKKRTKLKRLTRDMEATRKVLRQYNLEVVRDKGRLLIEEDGPSGKPLSVFEHDNFSVKSISHDKRLACFDRLYQSTRINPSSTLQSRLAKRSRQGHLYSVRYTPDRGKRAGREIEVLLFNNRQLWPAAENAFIRHGKIFRRVDISTLWTNEEISAVGISSQGGVRLIRGKKPEELLERIILLATNPGDHVMDPFAGSGTTPAVAQKLGRKWIAFEKSDSVEKLILPRLKRVVTGQDKSGVMYRNQEYAEQCFDYIDLPGEPLPGKP